MLAQMEQAESALKKYLLPPTANVNDSTEADQEIDVLIIKENPADVQQMFEGAEHLGIRFKRTCSEGIEAGLERLYNEPADVTLVDLSLPNAEGPAVVSKLLAQAPQTGVVALVDAKHRKLGLKAVEKGAQSYLLQELLNGNLLVRTLHYACERARMQQALGSFCTDLFTGMYNRHIFLVMGEQYLRLARRSCGAVAFYAVLEQCRTANPPLSFLEEQRLLMHAARVLKKNFRSSDLLTHWGRYEFAVLAVGMTPEHVPLLLNRLNKGVAEFNQERASRQQVLLSVGYSAFDPATNLTVGQLIGEADRSRRQVRKGA
jgi:diguanylate cyclase (GGDEF)-like protein